MQSPDQLLELLQRMSAVVALQNIASEEVRLPSQSTNLTDWKAMSSRGSLLPVLVSSSISHAINQSMLCTLIAAFVVHVCAGAVHHKSCALLIARGALCPVQLHWCAAGPMHALCCLQIRLQGVQVLAALLEQVPNTENAACAHRLRSPEAAPLVAYLTSMCLTTAALEVKAGLKGSKALRSAGLHALRLLLEAVADGDVLAPLLPGLASGLSNALLAASGEATTTHPILCLCCSLNTGRGYGLQQPKLGPLSRSANLWDPASHAR